MDPEDVDMDFIKTKLEAANHGESPLIAESSVDEDTDGAQATKGEKSTPGSSTDDG